MGKFIQLVSTFFGGFIIAFVKGWLLALVLLGCIPLIVIAGGVMALIMSKMASRGQIAYVEAGNIVEQTVGAIRTVVNHQQGYFIVVFSIKFKFLSYNINFSFCMHIFKVASFTGEKRAIEKYNNKIVIAYNVMTQQGLASGIGIGVVLMIVFGTYGLAIWYGSRLIIERGYNGGQVINVIFALMSGGM